MAADDDLVSGVGRRSLPGVPLQPVAGAVGERGPAPRGSIHAPRAWAWSSAASYALASRLVRTSACAGGRRGREDARRSGVRPWWCACPRSPLPSFGLGPSHGAQGAEATRVRGQWPFRIVRPKRSPWLGFLTRDAGAHPRALRAVHGFAASRRRRRLTTRERALTGRCVRPRARWWRSTHTPLSDRSRGAAPRQRHSPVGASTRQDRHPPRRLGPRSRRRAAGSGPGQFARVTWGRLSCSSRRRRHRWSTSPPPSWRPGGKACWTARCPDSGEEAEVGGPVPGRRRCPSVLRRLSLIEHWRPAPAPASSRPPA